MAMPKRVVDGDAVWKSMRLKKVEPPKYRAEFANLLPLALANGTFEVDPELVWAQVFAFNRPDVTPDDVVAMLDQFEKVKMLFRYEDQQKKWWGYWVGIEKAGRLPPPSERNREKRGPEPPAGLLQDFLGGSYPGLRQAIGGGSLGMGTGTGTCIGKGNCNGTGKGTGQQSQHSETRCISGLDQGKEPPAPVSDQVSAALSQSNTSVTPEPTVPPMPKPALANIRDWSEDRFGISGARLRNCILYQLDHSTNDWYRKDAEITLSKMEKRRFVTKLDADTPLGWSAESANAKKNNQPTDSGISEATQELVTKFGGRINEK
jgi:hypothetical protein